MTENSHIYCTLPTVLDTQKFMLPEQNRRRTSSESISGSTGKEKTTQFYLFSYDYLLIFKDL